MKRWVTLGLLLLLLGVMGCGSEKDRNVNTGRDKPKAGQQAD